MTNTMRESARFVIVADAGPHVGTGHLRRSACLARGLDRFLGAPVSLVTTPLGSELFSAQPEARPGAVVCHQAPRAELHERARQLVEAMNAPPVVIFDDHRVDAGVEATFAGIARLVVVISDLLDRTHACDVLIDQNDYHDSGDYAGLVPEGCAVLVGAPYLMLRREFDDWRELSLFQQEKWTRRDDCAAKPVFVSLGGGDPLNVLDTLCKALLDQIPNPLVVTCGEFVACRPRLEALAAQAPDRLQLHFDPPNIAELMSSCCFAVSAGGTMCWERAMLGLPSVTLAIVDNQIEITHYLSDKGAHIGLDCRDGIDWDALRRALADMERADIRRRLSRQSATIVRSHGVQQVCASLLWALSRKTSAQAGALDNKA